MKKLVALLFVVFLAVQGAYAGDFKFMKNLKFYGEGQITGYAIQNGYDLNLGKMVSVIKSGSLGGMLNSNYSGVVSFITTGLTFDIVNNVSADFSLSYSNDWSGVNKFASLINNPSNSAVKGNNLSSYLDNIRVQTANVTIKKLFDVKGLSVKVGRQYYGDEDSSIMYFGVRHDQPLFGLNLPLVGFDNVTSVNAVTLYYEKENTKANFIYANLGKILGAPLNFDGALLPLILNGNPMPFEGSIDLGRETTVIGADVKFLNIADTFNMQVYGYDIENPIVAHYSIAGLKPSISNGGLKASLEYAMNFTGKNPFEDGTAINAGSFKIKGNSSLLKADVSYDIEKKAVARASFAMQGGTEGIKELLNGESSNIIVKPFLNFGNYSPGIIFGQQTVTRLLSMVDFKAINVGADLFKKDFKFSLDYYNFSARDNGLNYGDELDFKVKYEYIKGLDFYFAAGCFMASDDINSKMKAGAGIDGFISEITSSVQLGASFKF